MAENVLDMKEWQRRFNEAMARSDAELRAQGMKLPPSPSDGNYCDDGWQRMSTAWHFAEIDRWSDG